MVKPRPVDTGYAWVICLASFVCILHLGLVVQAVAVLLVEIQTEFKTTIAVVSVAVMCFTIAVSITSIISTYILVPQFGERSIIMAAASLSAISSMSLSRAPDIYAFIVICGFKGAFAGTILIPVISIVSCYFNKYRSLATTITNSGVCFAVIIFPRLIRLIFEKYGLRQTFVIIGCLEFNMVLGGMMLRPTSFYGPPISPELKDSNLRDDAENVETNTPLSTKAEQLESQKEPCVEQKEIAEKSRVEVIVELQTPDPVQMHVKANPIRPMVSSGSQVAVKNKNFIQPPEAVVQAKSSSGSRVAVKNKKFPEAVVRARSKSSSLSHNAGMDSRRSTPTHLYSDNRNRKLSVGMDGVFSFCNSLNDMGTLAKVEGNQAVIKVPSKRNQSHDPAVFKAWAVRVWLLSSLPGATNQYLMIYMPIMCVKKGATPNEAAELFVMLGVVDLVSRFVFGYISDRKWLKPITIVATAQVCLGLTLHLGQFVDSFHTLVGWVLMTGVFVGTRFSLKPIVLVQLVGVETLPKVFSVTAFTSTMSASVHGPLLNGAMEYFASFTPVEHYIGSALMITGITISLLPKIARWDEKRKEKRQVGPVILEKATEARQVSP